MTAVTALPAVLKMARHPERIPATRTDSLFVAMAVAVCAPRMKPCHRLRLLRAIFHLMKRVEPSETLNETLATVWMIHVFALVFKTDPRTTDMQSVMGFRLLFDVEEWVCSQAVDQDETVDHPSGAVDQDETVDHPSGAVDRDQYRQNGPDSNCRVA
jgi:hypothetical protein